MQCKICGSDYSDNYYKNKYDDDIICEECLLEIDGISTHTVTHYNLDGEYMGSDDDMQELVESICDYADYEKIDENYK